MLDIYAFAPLGYVGSCRDYFCTIFKGLEVEILDCFTLEGGTYM
jgi:hypothetical protein